MRLRRYLTLRLLRMVPALLGITLVTFVLMDAAPSSRGELLLSGGRGELGSVDAAALDRLRVHWGMLDPQTGEPYSVWTRYVHWLGRAATLDFTGPGEDAGVFYDRITRALPVTVLVNGFGLLLALGLAIPLGARLGMRAGGVLDRGASALLFTAYGLPEFLVATFLLLAFAGGWGEAWLPGYGLASAGAERLGAAARLWDLLQHLCLPVLAVALAPAVIVTRFVRDAVARADATDFALALRALGLPPRVVRRRVLRGGLSPLVTLLGTLLPILVSGSVVVEYTFSLPGLGQLAFDAAMAKEYPMVMALTVLVSTATLLSLLLSDVLHRAVDPRVALR